MPIQLKNIATTAPKKHEKEAIIAKTKDLCKKMAELQHILYAEKKHGVLVVFQGMDASGKDGATRRVFGELSPIGMEVVAFKKPTELEMAHDFLWRVHQQVPQKGIICIFNRSHYEDILIQRVHNWIDMPRVEKRMQAINAFEELLQMDANTTVLKFYFHISKEEQETRLQDRIDSPEENWKHNAADWKERELWDQYMEAYEYAFNQSTIPWQIVPADQKWYRDYLIADAVVKALKNLKMKMPTFATNPELKN
ncbi:MAG: PPK2 family polyphosphate kinase [Saprospiraceae bacterium]